jgi:Fe-S cluster assembly protein SufB
MNEAVKNREIKEKIAREYEWGFSSDIEQEFAPKGLNEDTVRFISAKKNEPEWMLEWRLKAYRAWLEMEEVTGRSSTSPRSITRTLIITPRPSLSRSSPRLDELDPEIRAPTRSSESRSRSRRCSPASRARQGRGRRGVRQRLGRHHFPRGAEEGGVIFLSISEAIREHPELVRKYLGSVVPQRDNYFACLNSAVFSDGTFVYIPEGVRCPMELSTYFRINAENTGQFERTLIVADKGSYVSYLEGCTAPMRDENQLHAAVVEIFAHEDAEVKYSTVQNWYPGDAEGKGGIFNFVTKRALCSGRPLEGQLDPGRDRKRDHLEISQLHPQGRRQRRRILFGRADQQPPAGRHRHQDGAHRRQHALDDHLKGHQRGPQRQHLSRPGARAPARGECPQLHPVRQPAARRPVRRAHRALYRGQEPDREIEHEATTSKISEDQLFYAMSRGLDEEAAVALIVNGFAREVLKQLPMEFAVEAQKLLGISLEGSVG